MPSSPDSKSSKIRLALKAHPKATIKQIMEILKTEEDVDATYGLVHTIKNEKKRKSQLKSQSGKLSKHSSNMSVLRKSTLTPNSMGAFDGFMSIRRELNRMGGMGILRAEMRKLRPLVSLCGSFENLEALLQS